MYKHLRKKRGKRMVYDVRFIEVKEEEKGIFFIDFFLTLKPHLMFMFRFHVHQLL